MEKERERKKEKERKEGEEEREGAKKEGMEVGRGRNVAEGDVFREPYGKRKAAICSEKRYYGCL